MECSQDGGILPVNQILLNSCSNDFQRFYGHMFKHFLADVWSGCSVLSVIDSGEKSINGKSLIWFNWHRMGHRITQQSRLDW